MRGLSSRALVLGAWLTACVPPNARPAPEPPEVEVLAVAARFAETRGVLEVRLAVPNRFDAPLVARQVTWEAWLSGRRFASGVQALSESVDPREERVVYLTLPLAFRRMALAPGPVHLSVGIRGRVLAEVGGAERGLPFARQMDIVSEGAPIFPKPGEEED